MNNNHSELRKSLRNETMYQVFVRNYSKAGTLNALKADLPRIKDLGVSILYLLPIHPIGKVARKGKVGSPYSIKDYRAIDKAQGTMEEFQTLINEAHNLDLKVFMDIVFNHTSRDSKMLKMHPDWFFYRNGKLANRVGDWSDIGDLDFTNMKMRKYLIDTLIKYVNMGVDGFRCDVAPLVPLDFWLDAVQAVNKINPSVIWYSESIEMSFLKYMRGEGHHAHADAEMYQAFDILYNYDAFPLYTGYFEGKNTLEQYLHGVNLMEVIYPEDYLKTHCLENHDQQRAHHTIKNELSLRNFTAWSFFVPGVSFLYAGQEVKATKRPDLFEKDPIDLTITDQAFYNLIKKLIAIKKDKVFKEKTYFNASKAQEGDVIIAELRSLDETYLGIFNLSEGVISISLPYDVNELHDSISDQTLIVNNGSIEVKEPIIAKIR